MLARSSVRPESEGPVVADTMPTSLFRLSKPRVFRSSFFFLAASPLSLSLVFFFAHGYTAPSMLLQHQQQRLRSRLERRSSGDASSSSSSSDDDDAADGRRCVRASFCFFRATAPRCSSSLISASWRRQTSIATSCGSEKNEKEKLSSEKLDSSKPQCAVPPLERLARIKRRNSTPTPTPPPPLSVLQHQCPPSTDDDAVSSRPRRPPLTS